MGQDRGDYSRGNGADVRMQSRASRGPSYARGGGDGQGPPSLPPGARRQTLRPSDPRNSGATPSAPGGRRPAGGGSGGGGLLRPPLIAGGPGDDGDDAYGRSGPTPSARRNSSPRGGDTPSRSARSGASDYGNTGRPRSRSDADRYDTPASPRSGRRSMGEMARDVSRSMSRQLSSVVARAGRGAPQGDSFSRRPAPGRTDSALMARRTPPADDESLSVAAQRYRRSRARMLARKWRLGRVRPNPIGYAIGIAAVVIVVLVFVAGGTAGGVYSYSYYSGNVDKIQAVADLKYHANSQILDRNGKLIYTAKGEDQYHIYVPLSQMSPLIQDATIDIEDHSFYSNSGVDINGTIRAALADARAGGAAVQGGSTITQQLVKLLVINNSEKSYTRKIHEAILAYGVTAQYDKAQILEMYLNEIDYSYPNLGIEAASANYFGYQQIKKPDGTVTTANQQLELWQAALLAGVPNGPTIYKPNVYSCDKAPCPQSKWDNPYTGAPCASSYIDAFGPRWYSGLNSKGHEWLVYCRAQLVLSKMVQYGSTIPNHPNYTQAQADDALRKLKAALEGETILTKVNTSLNGATTDNLAPHFVQYVEEQLSEQFGLNHLENAGLRIYTTLDLDLNQFAQKNLHYYIAEAHADPWYGGGCTACPPLSTTANAHNGALVAIDQHTGDILSMVGSVDYTDQSKQVAGNVNVAIQNRSMGSATKPVVYATAFQMGWNPGTMLQDVPICFPNPAIDDTTHKPIEDADLPACTGWYVPHNFDRETFSGLFPARRALANSLNIPATETMSFVGATAATSNNILTMAQRLGITSLDAGHMGPSTALGTQDIPLMQLTGAYGAIANLGKRMPSRAILQIEDSTGQVKWTAPATTPIQAISPQAAYMMTSILADNPARRADFGDQNPLHFATRTNDKAPNFPLAAKTGTSSGDTGPRDIITAGYSPYMTLGVWMGNDNGESMPDIIGIKGPGYIFHDVMAWAFDHYHWDANAQFPVPSGLARGTFNCNTGLAPYKDSKPETLKCVPLAQPWPADRKWNAIDLYSQNGANENNDHTDTDWYIANAPPLQS